MITKERIKKAKNHLLIQAKQIEEHIEKIRKMSKDKFLDKWDGKVVDKRIYVPIARLYRCTEMKGKTGPLFPDTSFCLDHLPAPLGPGIKMPQLKIKVCLGWGDFGIPLICEWDGNYKLNAMKTRDAWEKIIEHRKSWANKLRKATTKVSKAASTYNKVEREVVKLFDYIGTRDGLEVTTLFSFKGDIYKRLDPFRWQESSLE